MYCTIVQQVRIDTVYCCMSLSLCSVMRCRDPGSPEVVHLQSRLARLVGQLQRFAAYHMMHDRGCDLAATGLPREAFLQKLAQFFSVRLCFAFCAQYSTVV